MSGGIAESLKRVCDSGALAANALRRELELLNARIKRSMDPAGAAAEIDFYELSRHVLYAALSLTDNRRAAMKRRPRAKIDAEAASTETLDAENIAWRFLLEPYAELYTQASLVLAAIDNDDALQKFARLESRTHGVRQKPYYVSLAILIVHLSDLKLLATSRFTHLCPKSELDFPERVRAVIEGIIAVVDGRAPPELPVALPAKASPPSAEFTAPAVWIRFPYSVDRLHQLVELQSHFAFSADRCAHFMVYRPSRSDPCKLIKSYFILRSPEYDHDLVEAEAELEESDPDALEGRLADIVEFRHFYRPPDNMALERVSAGRAIPLEEGLYLIGGQRVGKKAGLPYTALKVLALPWNSIKHRQQVFGGLAISTNLQGYQIASRVAIRATPIDHSSKVQLGGLAIDELLGNLKIDMEVERRLIEAEATRGVDPKTVPYAARLVGGALDEQLANMTAQILKLCNNVRQDSWDVFPGFQNSEHRLDKTLVAAEVRRLFDTSDPYVRHVGGRDEVLSLAAIRVGPLIHD